MPDKSENPEQSRRFRADKPHPLVWLTVQGEIASFSKVRAGVLDAGPGGVCLLTDSPLELGQLLTIHDSRQEFSLPRTGIVVWTSETLDGCRLGVRSINSPRFQDD